MKRRPFAALPLALALFACDAPGREPTVDATEARDPATLQAEIETAMADSAAGWNEGDMARFLAIYSDAPETSFIGSSGLVRGKAAMEARYRDAYDWSKPEPAERGTLTFETQDVRPLGPDNALYIGRYILSFPEGSEKEPATGLTSLVFANERSDDGADAAWRIVADHSS